MAGEMITDDPVFRGWLGRVADAVDDPVSDRPRRGGGGTGLVVRAQFRRPTPTGPWRMSDATAASPAAGRGGAMDIEPVKSTRIYEEIVRQVKQLIADGKLKSGDQLPPERDLAEKFMVSRTSVREALRALQSRGLVEIRAGEGAFVRDISVETLIEPLALVILPHREAVGELFEARRLLEPAIAALAARRATREELGEMERILDDQAKEVSQGRTGVAQDTALHAAIANSAHNRAITRIVSALMDLAQPEPGGVSPHAGPAHALP